MGLFSSPDIAYQFGWSINRNLFFVSSFNVEHNLSNLEDFWELVSNPDKVSALIREGLKTIPKEQADYFEGKQGTTGTVDKVIGVRHSFETVDEWHTTDIEVDLLLNTTSPVHSDLLKKWIENHWRDIQTLAGNVKTPSVAPRPSYYGEDQDLPAPGLGWVTAKNIRPSDFEEVKVHQNGNKATARIHVGIR